MSDEKKYREMDLAIQKRVDAIYSDPKRHAFISEFDTLKDSYGPRGGLKKGRKTICYYCGCKSRDHAKVTERI
jgi:hypothetical protein